MKVKLKVGEKELVQEVYDSQDCWRIGAFILDRLREKPKIKIYAEAEPK